MSVRCDKRHSRMKRKKRPKSDTGHDDSAVGEEKTVGAWNCPRLVSP